MQEANKGEMRGEKKVKKVLGCLFCGR